MHKKLSLPGERERVLVIAESPGNADCNDYPGSAPVIPAQLGHVSCTPSFRSSECEAGKQICWCLVEVVPENSHFK